MKCMSLRDLWALPATVSFFGSLFRTRKPFLSEAVVYNGRSLYFQEHLREIGMPFVIITMRDSAFLGDEP